MIEILQESFNRWIVDGKAWEWDGKTSLWARFRATYGTEHALIRYKNGYYYEGVRAV